MSFPLGVVILAYGVDAATRVGRLVDELVRDGVTANCVTVVHNPSPASSTLGPLPAKVDLIETGRNLGYAGGMNLGIRRQTSDGRPLLLLLTDDVRLEPGAVEHLLAAAARAPRYGILGPALRWQGREVVSSFGGRVTATGAGWLINEAPVDEDGDNVTPCDYIDGCAMLIRSEVLANVGLLTERFFMYFEESELCLRARRAGWLVGVALDSRASQTSGESKRPGAFNYLMARNGLEFARLVGGPRAQVAAVGRDLAQTVRLLKMRYSPKSDEERRHFAQASLGGLWAGVAAYFRGRWGPPPGNLPGMGDVRP